MSTNWQAQQDIIHGPARYRVPTHIDGRGNSAHNIFNDLWHGQDDGQTNYSTIQPGVVKAFHWHKNQTDRWHVVAGTAHVVLVDFGIRDIEAIKTAEISLYDPARPMFSKPIMVTADGDKHEGEIQHHYLSPASPFTLVIPPGVLHGYRAVFGQPATVLYHVSNRYDPESPDEFRVAYDAFGKEVWETSNE